MPFLIGIAADHAGKELKNLVKEMLELTDHEIVDYGVASNTTQSVDYPDYAQALAQDVSSGKLQRGIAICGTGIGMAIVANKFPGVRAVAVWDEFSTRMSRAHNDTNFLCLGSRTINQFRVIDLVRLWLDTPFEGARHEVRLQKIQQIERQFKR